MYRQLTGHSIALLLDFLDYIENRNAQINCGDNNARISEYVFLRNGEDSERRSHTLNHTENNNLKC